VLILVALMVGVCRLELLEATWLNAAVSTMTCRCELACSVESVARSARGPIVAARLRHSGGESDKGDSHDM